MKRSHMSIVYSGDKSYYCEPCCQSRDINSSDHRFDEEGFRRHLTETNAHPSGLIACRCRRWRKDRFLKVHVPEGKICRDDGILQCHCGKVETGHSDASFLELKEHVRSCGNRRPGRKKGTKSGPRRSNKVIQESVR